jgi:SSS family solute:Na+ symporter
MAGMAANISAFNTVFSYDLWQTYVVKDRDDSYYLNLGRIATVGATVIAIGTALIASQYTNLMNYLQTLFGFFNAPLFATFILGMFWKRMTATAGWMGLVSGTLGAVAIAFLSEDAFGSASLGVIPLKGQGASFVAALVAFVVDILVSVVVSTMTKPREYSELKGLVYSLTPKKDFHDENEGQLAWYQKPPALAGLGLVLVIGLNAVFW